MSSKSASNFGLQRRDSPWRDAYVNVLSGPYDMPSTDALRQAVSKLAREHPYSRLNWSLEQTGRSWQPDRKPESIVTEGVWNDNLTTGQLLDAMNHDESLQPPLALVRYPNHLGWRMSHAIGDGGMFPVILTSVMNTAFTGRVADWPPHPAGRFPLLTAGLRTFGRHPSMIRSAIANRYDQDRTAESTINRPWAPSRRTICTVVDRDRKREMKQWAEESAPQATDFSLMMCSVLRALKRVDLTVSRDVHILVDLRRYLGAGWIDGNFIAGVPMRIVADTLPQQISATIRATKKSGRPLANQMLASLRGGRSPAPAPESIDPNSPPRITFSQVMRSPEAEKLPFLDVDRLVYTGSVEPAGPHGVTVLFVDILGATTVSAAFHDNVVDPTAIDRALKLVALNPVGLLSDSVTT